MMHSVTQVEMAVGCPGHMLGHEVCPGACHEICPEHKRTYRSGISDFSYYRITVRNEPVYLKVPTHQVLLSTTI
jgi:hypothetical protein